MHAHQRVDQLVEDRHLRVLLEAAEARHAGRVRHEHGRMVGVHREDVGHRQARARERGVDLGLAPQRVRLVWAGTDGVGAEEPPVGGAVGRGEGHVPRLMATASGPALHRNRPGAGALPQPRLHGRHR